MGLLIYCQAWGTTLDGFPPRAYLRGRSTEEHGGVMGRVSMVCTGLLWEVAWSWRSGWRGNVHRRLWGHSALLAS